MDESEDATDKPKRPLDYWGDRKRPLIPPRQSVAGIVSTVPAAALVLLTIGMFLSRYGEAIGGLLCLSIPCTLTAIICGVLGVTEEAPDGVRRDARLARYSLFATALCWGALGIWYAAVTLLRK